MEYIKEKIVGTKIRNSHRLLVVLSFPLLLAACQDMKPLGGPLPLDLLGAPAPITAAIRTIVITPETQWVNVEGGEIVRFIVGNQMFAWNFIGWGIDSFELNRVAPPGLLKQKITAYVSPDPRFRDGVFRF